MEIEVTTTHLTMNSQSLFRPKYRDDERLTLQKVGIPNPNLNHFFFANVGNPFQWFSRLSWNYKDWYDYVHKANVQTWVGYKQGSPYGYFELESQNGTIEMKFFGILKQFIGQGLGAHLLSHAIDQAWATTQVNRIYLHTCTLDHESALKNYLARGFTIEKQDTEFETIPDDDDLIWNSPNYYQSLRNQT